MSHAGRVLAGRYRLDRHLAEGGMGEVWVAHHLTLDVPVAVKLMSLAGESRQDLRQRFEREAKAVAQLKSPHVVQIFDYGTDHERPFIVMELLRGTDLLELLRFRPKWALPEVAGLVFQVTKGLAAAHALGIIHRDIKPGNIFLTRSGDEVTAKILDFGIAKITAAEQQITATNAVLGSPFYLSPEQLRSEPLDARVDLWALAVVAYRLVTGHVPFDGDSGYAIAENILRGEREEIPTSITRGLELEKYFRRALADQREDRFATPTEFAEEFFKVAGPPGSLLPVLDPIPDAPTLRATRNSVADARAAARAAQLATPPAPLPHAEITEDTTEQQDDAPTVIGKRSPAAYLAAHLGASRREAEKSDPTPTGETTPTEIHQEAPSSQPPPRPARVSAPPRPTSTVPRPGAAGTGPVPRVGRPPPHTRARQPAMTTRMTSTPAPPIEAPPAPAAEPPPSSPRPAFVDDDSGTVKILANRSARAAGEAPRSAPETPRPSAPPMQPAPMQPAPMQPAMQPAPMQPAPMQPAMQPAPMQPAPMHPAPVPMQTASMPMQPAPAPAPMPAPAMAPPAPVPAPDLQPQPTMLMAAAPNAPPSGPSREPPPSISHGPQPSNAGWNDISAVQNRAPTWNDVSSVQGSDPSAVPPHYLAQPQRRWPEDDTNDTVQMERRGVWSSPPVLILIGLGTLAFVFFTWAVVLGLGK